MKKPPALTLPFPEHPCPGCGAANGWLELGEACGCGWRSARERRTLHIRAWYVSNRAVATLGKESS